MIIPDFPNEIRIRLAELKKKMLLPDFANYLPCWLAQQSQEATKKINSVILILMSIGMSGDIKFEFQTT